jgi:Ser-tRNA(Ala) deacylase AlaX
MTKLLYLDHMHDYEAEARLLERRAVDERIAAVVDQTIFYPQGGGQPSDTGVLRSSAGEFRVTDVRSADDETVLHFGEGALPEPGDPLTLLVDRERRDRMTRVHSGGHLVDLALHRLGFDWKPGRGYHFPDGPYVEYRADVDPSRREELIREIESAANEILREDAATTIRYVDRAEAERVLTNVPPWIREEGLSRIVFYGDFGVPCGGTHVAKLSDIGSLTIRKLKIGSGSVRVSYAVG